MSENKLSSRRPLTVSAMLAVVFLVGCGATAERPPPPQVFDDADQRLRDRYGTVTGQDGITLLGRGRQGDPGLLNQNSGGGGGGIGVNAFLWRASLETIDFIPLASADPFGGLIITDWYQPPTTPDQQLKVQVLIRDAALRADGVKVTVFRQVREEGSWRDAPVDPATQRTIEDKILTRARELRIASLES